MTDKRLKIPDEKTLRQMKEDADKVVKRMLARKRGK